MSCRNAENLIYQWFLTFFSIAPPVSNCPLFQAPLTLNKP